MSSGRSRSSTENVWSAPQRVTFAASRSVASGARRPHSSGPIEPGASERPADLVTDQEHASTPPPRPETG